MDFHIYSLILLGYVMTNIVVTLIIPMISAHSMCDNFYNEIHYLRNNALRAILSTELNRTKHKLSIIKRMINRNILHKYNKVLSRYYDVNYNYNRLTYAEKTLLEVIVSLTY